MSGKSRLSKQKHAARSKRKKGKQSSVVSVAQRQTGELSTEAAPQPVTPLPSSTVPAPKTTKVAARHFYVTGELRRISMLAAIILVILVVLARVLS